MIRTAMRRSSAAVHTRIFIAYAHTVYTVRMRFEVPQFIEVEDKIFGPFTWKQFIYLAGGAGAAVILYILLPFFLFLIFAAPIAALAAGLAFFPVNNRPLSVFIESMFQYFMSARLYLWKKRAPTPAAPMQPAEKDAPHYAPPKTNNIASLSRRLELNALQRGEGR